MKSPILLCGLTLALLGLTACSTMPKKQPLVPVSHVELAPFMGDWYVVANIPYFAERDCVASVESYKLLPNGTIDTVFTARKPDFDGKEMRVKTLGIVTNKKTNAEWQVQPIWPIRIAYVVIDLDPDYQFAVIGHPSRNYAWILSRTPTLPDATFDGILRRMASQGYDTSRIAKVPQRVDAPAFPVPGR
ncbi:MAG: lipocalin family protein [Chthoniobacterales bacterium]